LYPVIALLPGILGWSRADSDEAKLAKLGRFGEQNGVSRAEGVPLLMSLLGMAPSERFPLAPMSPELQKQRTLQTLAGAALAVAARQPVLAVVEDLHWIDPTTLELLSSLVDQIPTVPFLVVLTARLGFQAPWPPHSHVTPLVLTRFSKRQAAQMVAHIAGTTPLPEDVVSQIVLRTDGVPLFVEELSKLVVESRVVAPESAERTPTGPPPELAIPATLQDSLEARLDRLSTVKVIAQLGATLGREFPYALLRAVSDLDDAVLERELGRLVDAELLYQRGAAPEATYVFKHALIQEAAYQSLLRGTRQQYHQRVARVMVEQFSAEAEAHPEYVARHFTDGADVPSAVQWWRKAGQHAFRRAAFREAAAHFGKGLGVVSAAPPSGRRDQMELGLQVELGYALIPIRGWASPEAAAAFTRAGELSRQTGDTPALFRALWGLAAFHFVRGDQRRASEVAEQCLATAKAADDADALSAAHYLCGITACVMGKFAEGQRELEACVRLFRDETRESHRALYGQDAKASALGWLAMALWVMGQPDAALDRAEQAAAHVRDANQPFLLARGLASIGFVRVFRGDPQGPDSPLQQALDLCVEQGFTYFQAVVSAFQGTNLVHLGRTADGVAMMQASIAALRRIGSELLFTVILANLAAAQLALERIDEGLATVAEGLECVERTGEHWAEAELHRLRGELLLALGDSAAGEPEACFARALQVARAQQAAAYEARAANALERCRVV
jgi:tetratricopeptide (TPR) repeat protein